MIISNPRQCYALAMPSYIIYLDIPTNYAIYDHGVLIEFFTFGGTSRFFQSIAYNRHFPHEA